MKHITLTMLLAALLISACHQSPEADSYALADMAMEEEMMPITRQQEVAPPPPPLPAIEKPSVEKKIIKDGRMGLKVSDLPKAKMRVDSLVKLHGAYYANERFNNYDYETSYSLSIRIPNEQFELFIATIEPGKAELLYKEVDARDVTDQFIDLETRLANKRNYLKRYNALLTKAKTIKEILEIEEKIRRLEEEIESKTGRLKYLNDQVKYSTLQLNISQPKDFEYSPAKRDKFSEQIKQSFTNGWYGFIDFLLVLVKIWPFWFVGAFIIYLVRKLRMRKRLKNNKEE